MLTTRELFLLDERTDIERAELSQSDSETHVLYLFQCDTLLAEGHLLAIDEQRGMIGVYQEQTVLHEIPMNGVEIAVLTLLLLSAPLPISDTMLQNICSLHDMREGKNDDAFKQAITDLIRACNTKLKTLNLAIASLIEEYCLITISEGDDCVAFDGNSQEKIAPENL